MRSFYVVRSNKRRNYVTIGPRKITVSLRNDMTADMENDVIYHVKKLAEVLHPVNQTFSGSFAHDWFCRLSAITDPIVKRRFRFVNDKYIEINEANDYIN